MAVSSWISIVGSFLASPDRRTTGNHKALYLESGGAYNEPGKLHAWPRNSELDGKNQPGRGRGLPSCLLPVTNVSHLDAELCHEYDGQRRQYC